MLVTPPSGVVSQLELPMREPAVLALLTVPSLPLQTDRRFEKIRRGPQLRIPMRKLAVRALAAKSVLKVGAELGFEKVWLVAQFLLGVRKVAILGLVAHALNIRFKR